MGIYAPFARDVYSFTLGYYNNDYTPIGGSGANAFSLSYTAPTNLDNSGNQLFNGNISNSTLSLSNLNGGLPVGYSYGYDQLNRITGMRQHTIANGASSWSNSNIINDYKEDVAYDANGNILKYLRNGTTQGGSPLGMDSLTYFYNANTNQLNTIHDSVPAGNYSVDIDNQNANNYAYDSIGNLIKDNSVGLSDVLWTVYGKIKEGTSSGITEQYSYDANNNRVIKTVQLGGITGKQYYIRDAQGNILAVYTYDGSTLKWAEQDLYGSSRVGLWSWNNTIPAKVMLPQSETDTLSDWYLLGSRDYELTNHLGNVLSVITDKKVGVSSGGSIVDYYKAEVLSQTDYYPFGMEEPGRSMSAIPYPYAFNGKRMENVELYTSNQYDYGMRYYDARVGRFYSVDPLTSKYPELSPYAFAGNTPIRALDLGGLEILDYRTMYLAHIYNSGLHLGFSVTVAQGIQLSATDYYAVLQTENKLKDALGSQYLTYERDFQQTIDYTPHPYSQEGHSSNQIQPIITQDYYKKNAMGKMTSPTNMEENSSYEHTGNPYPGAANLLAYLIKATSKKIFKLTPPYAKEQAVEDFGNINGAYFQALNL